MGVLWDSPNAPKWMHPDDFTKTVSRTINGGLLKTLAASQTSIRGPHPSRLRLDECIAYDRRVATLDGDAPICYISKGVKVWCWDGSDFVPGTVKKAICKGRRKTLKIYLSTGKTLIVTGNHPMLTKNGWKHAEDCSTEDVLLGGPLDPVDVRILEIAPGGLEEVWDLQVSPHHNFVAEGVVVHNCDELDINLFDAAMGQTMSSRGVKAQTVASSTHQHAFGTVTTLLQRARENSWQVHEWCVAEGSLVLTDQGEIPIESVAPGMKVATRKGWRSVQHCTYVGDKRVLSLDVSNGRVLRVTADHKVATPMGWLEARHLLRGLLVEGVDLSRGYSLQPILRYVEGLSWTNIPEAVPVYDIGVEDCHEFVVEGVVVHNCYRENLKSNGGWLDDEEVTRKKNEVTRDMWEIEYENQAPNPESYAIDPDAVDALFDRSLGVFPGRMQETVVINTPTKATRYYHGADWARSRDSTIIHTMAEVPGGKDVLTHWTRTGRVSWPLMISKFNERVKKLGGPACHDSTGLGAVVDDYIKVPAYGINLQSQVRADIFNEFIVAIERGDQMVFPFIESMYHDFKYASWEDIFGGKHPPDSFVAAALAWEAKRRGSRLNIFRL